MNNEIINKFNIAKEEWLNKQCSKLEKEQYKDTKSMHRRIGDIVGKRACSFTGCVKEKSGEIMERHNLRKMGRLYWGIVR